MDHDKTPLVPPHQPQTLVDQANDMAEAPKTIPNAPARPFPLQQYPPQIAPPPQPPQLPARPRGKQVETPEMWRARVKRVTISTLKEIAKTLILIICLTIYSILGAFAFQALEKPNEKDTCLANEGLYLGMENDTANALWKAALMYQTVENPDLQEEIILKMVQNFSVNLMSIGYDGRNCSAMGEPGGPQYSWNFPGSLLFAVTIFTTVGYGNIAPKTDWGRMFCIAYAMIGLPLMFFTLANIGEHMAVVFRFVYVKVCCLGLCAKRRHSPTSDSATLAGQKPGPWGSNYSRVVDDDEEDEEEEITIPLTITLLVIAGYVGLGALMFAVWENWNAMSAAYFTFITISTIGLGDLVPGFNNTGSDAQGSLKLLTCAAYMLFGMSLLSMGFDLIQYEMANKMTVLGGQNVGRAGDTVNELQGKEEHSMPDVAHPARMSMRAPGSARPGRNSDDKKPKEVSWAPKEATSSM